MGALHNGHLGLVNKSISLCNHTVVTIFVNPRQFNNPEDLKKYPKTISEDLKKLASIGTEIVFIPNKEEIYQGPEAPDVSISPLDSVFEGEYRPGHYKGVVQVLYHIFNITKPNYAFFGLKDLQQCLVIEKLIKKLFPHLAQHNEPTQRETSGLAMSSRNQRLSEQGKKMAASIYTELSFLSNHQADFNSSAQKSMEKLKAKGIETEYLNLINLPNMEKTNTYDLTEQQAIVFSGFLEGVRLIDNVLL